MNLFPSVQPAAAPGAEHKLYKEVKWDYETNTPVYINGSPAVVSGREAVLVWAWKALNTPRYRHEIYTWDYGNDTEQLIGQPFTGDLKRAEAARYVKECLMINPYITGVENITVAFNDGTVNILCTIKTIYGEGVIDV